MDPAEIPERLIDIEALFAAKNPQLLKIIPGFIIRYLKKITHQEEINGYIYRNRDKFGVPFLDAILKEFGVKVEVDSILNSQFSILNSGRYLIAANHPLGGMDGMALMYAIGQVRGDIVFPVNDLLMNVPGLKPLFIPINKHGSNTENARIIAATFASDKTILYFPAGLCSRKQGGGTICDLEWKKTFITKARQYQRDVIPIFITGRNSNWFYNLANWRKRLGIKANLEMLYLVDEMVKQKGQTIRLIVGDTIPYGTFDRSRSDNDWAAWVKGIVYELGVMQ
jgi:putative hemolysin